ncbi:hypothetical protein Taro_024677 [Colocasia esculenta]|uniref:Uncharacterized protein n=1 Tax=Colocasia esculenta TaxID=4460 RepID=A0A843V844_COLES|nr:hypothetical protein [Colocasia esculenta]
MSPPRTARHERDPCTNGATPSSARPPQHGGGTPNTTGTPRGREGKSGKGKTRERGKSSGARALSPDPEKATHLVSHWEPEGDIGYVAFKKATHPLSQSIKPEGDIGYVAFKKATYPLSHYEAEPDIVHDQNHVATVALP